jgi:glycosyltransferase involved in cell wall biosynthesis
MRVAIVADWLPTYAGAEHVLADILRIWPDAPLFTTVARHGALGPLDAADIRTSRLQTLYGMTRDHRVLLAMMPRALEDLDLSGFDVVVSSSHAVGKGIIPPPSGLHCCYCHTPMRYAWEMEEDYLRDFRIPRLFRGFIRRTLSRLRRWDLSTAKRVDCFIANSPTTQERIARIYARESTVIPPPVDDRFFSAPIRAPQERTYLLAVGRLVPYKRFDLLIEVANAMQLPLKIAGKGTDRERLKKLAGPTVEFLGFVPDAELPSLYAGAKVLLFPQIEDAGVVLLEAQACGTPVVAFGEGGARDVIEDGITGLLFPSQTAESLSDAVRRADAITWDHGMIQARTKAFSQEQFRTKLRTTVTQAYETFRSTGHARNFSAPLTA